MNFLQFLSLLCFAIVMTFTPGPNNLMLLSSGLRFGFKNTIPHIIGAISGFVLLILAIGLGLGSFFKHFPLAMDIFKYIGICYLLYLAYKIAFYSSSPPLTETETAADFSKNSSKNVQKPFTILQAMSFQAVNPKGITMAIITVSSYIPRVDYFYNLLIVCCVFLFIFIAAASTWAGAGTAIKKFLKHPKWVRIFNTTMAILLVLTIPTLFL